ncbi:elongation factor G [Endozoicomonas sp. (ex Bugula neritina AB1)]|nr:elongation factor G [Endozoicomonas sp. (ex Bugula neritina AB1)]
MAAYHHDHIRNLALFGHAGSGKSALAEAMLFKSGAAKPSVNRKGATITDFTDQEKEAGHSLETSILHFEHHNTLVNIIDTPGFPDFFGRAMSILPAVESVALVVNARQGLESITRKAYEQIQNRKKCGLIIINGCDLQGADPLTTLKEIQHVFGSHCLPINLPSANNDTVVDCYFNPSYETAVAFSSVSEAHDALVEQVVEVDEELMELYLEQDQSLEPLQLHDSFEQALREGHLIPVCFTSVETGAGIELLMDIICEQMPTPREGNPPLFLKGKNANPVVITADPEQHAIAHVFKITVDPFIGQMGVFRVHQGVIRNGSQLFVGDARKPFRVNHLLKLQGGQYVEIDEAGPGEICAVAKVDSLYFDAVIHDSHDEDEFFLKPLAFPSSMASLAISPARRGDEQKLSEVLHRMTSEDPSIHVEHRERANETVITGLGALHLNSLLNRMRDVYGLAIDTKTPSISYRETINAKAEGHYRHKKQNGGSGQFGEVYLRIEPMEPGSGFEFASEVVGGVIPSQFIPAVEKGVRDVMNAGAVAGYPMQDIRVVVYDGKHHSVDSKEVAFVAAGKKAFLEAIAQAQPIILEPYAELTVTAPDGCIGDITGHIASERGMVIGSEVVGNGKVCIKAKAPMANLGEYSNQLKAMTSGEGEYEASFSHYDAVPNSVQKALMKLYNEA